MTAAFPYIRVYQPKPSGILASPGVPDLSYVPPVANGTFALSAARLSSVFGTNPPDSFVVGTTKPVLVDPLNPVGTDNVGWTGDTSGGTFTTTHTVPSNTRMKGCVFLCDVILTDATSILEDCIVFGGAPTASRPGLITMNNGGQLIRVTVWGTHSSVVYYRNATRLSAGVLTATRCAFYRCTDALRGSGGQIRAYGCMFDWFAFWDNDADQGGGTPPNWSHNDALQMTAGAGPHEFIGNVVISRCDTTGVTWSGGSPGSGTASNGAVPAPVTSRPTTHTPIGMPATQLNAGYRNAFMEGLYCNGVSFTNSTGFIATINDNWFEGSNNPSANVQFTTGTTNQITMLRNKFGVAGYRTGLTKFLASYNSATTTKNTGTGADVNVFGSFPSTIAAGIVGDPVTVTTGGLRYTAP